MVSFYPINFLANLKGFILQESELPEIREPTEEEKGISAEAKKARGKKVWDWLLGETNNFGRGFDEPKWGKKYKGRPGMGGRHIRPGKYTVK